MAKQTGTLRGRIFKTPLALRHRLKYVRGLLDWAYGVNRSPADLQKEFWEWYTGVYAGQAMQAVPHAWGMLMRDTSGWDWPALQSQVRNIIKALLLPKGKVRKLRPITVERGLGIWKAEDGKRYFHYSTRPDLRLDQSAYAEAAVDMMLSDLHGISTEVMNVCGVCGRPFIAVRPTRSMYCSGACRNRAFLKAHGFKPPMKEKRRGRNREPTQRA